MPARRARRLYGRSADFFSRYEIFKQQHADHGQTVTSLFFGWSLDGQIKGLCLRLAICITTQHAERIVLSLPAALLPCNEETKCGHIDGHDVLTESGSCRKYGFPGAHTSGEAWEALEGGRGSAHWSQSGGSAAGTMAGGGGGNDVHAGSVAGGSGANDVCAGSTVRGGGKNVVRIDDADDDAGGDVEVDARGGTGGVDVSGAMRSHVRANASGDVSGVVSGDASGNGNVRSSTTCDVEGDTLETMHDAAENRRKGAAARGRSTARGVAEGGTESRRVEGDGDTYDHLPYEMVMGFLDLAGSSQLPPEIQI